MKTIAVLTIMNVNINCITLRCVTLCRVVLRCVVLCCVALCCVVLRCTILHYIDCYRQRENIKKIIHTLKRLEEQSTSNEVFVLDHIDQMAMRD